MNIFEWELFALPHIFLKIKGNPGWLAKVNPGTVQLGMLGMKCM